MGVKQHGCAALETVTLLFGLFSSVVSGVGLIICAQALERCISAGSGLWSSSDLFYVPGTNSDYLWQEHRRSLYVLAVHSGLFLFTLEFTFSVLLTIGVSKRRSSYVMIYFVYGAVKNILGTVSAILSVSLLPISFSSGASFICGCIVYYPVLFMIYKTYRKLSRETSDKCPETEPAADQYQVKVNLINS